mmetsp:Transcript_27746/g.69515  ORF Transcript_27746/g.69515 Transcript_27746/m.69515 type:complete len:141 (+) Transcript_27746:114-536(+)|eukprot:CAMPEP_0177636970 /NCGR_PEP_ID=MMETSP0447-20121125/4724_1 /TAXON_ID=0 /ORGANISM="Stygamoeba regulata, Strain BSH-02190019" /LENGTH=140 /DNA_ID=CAMNT_0019138871 /DNA_START=111 /DNA_END=533 /DNA_ORIENTATION=-
MSYSHRSYFPEDFHGADDNDDENASLLARQSLAQLEEQREGMAFSIEQREEGIQQLQTSFMDLNQLWKDLGSIVSVQGGILDNIETHIDNSQAQTQAGAQELAKAAQHQRTLRSRLCCLVLVVLLAVVLFLFVLSFIKYM